MPNLPAVPSGIVILPKISISGKAVMTATLASEIVGMEPTKIEYNGKKFTGTKCYTVHGDSFKVVSDPVATLQQWHFAKNEVTALSQVQPLVSIPGYVSVTKLLPSSTK